MEQISQRYDFYISVLTICYIVDKNFENSLKSIIKPCFADMVLMAGFLMLSEVSEIQKTFLNSPIVCTFKNL